MRRRLLVLVASSVLHALVLGLIVREEGFEEPAAGVVDAEGDEGDLDDADEGGAEVGEGATLVSVSVLVDPTPGPAKAPVAVKPAPKPKKAKPVEGAVVAEVGTGPVAPVEPPPVVEPVPAPVVEPEVVAEEVPVGEEDLPEEAEDSGVAEAEITTDDQGEALPTLDAKRLDAVRAKHEARARKRGHPKPKGDGKTCVVDPDDGVARVSPWSWRVERGVVDYYATHMRELLKLGSVSVHKDARGRPEGFKVTLRKCSLLKQTGLASGDVVRDINGIKVKDIFGAIRAYFKLRTEDHIVVNLERKGQPLKLSYELTEEDVDAVPVRHAPGRRPMGAVAPRAGVAER